MSKLPDANPTLTAYLVRQQRQALRQAQSSAFTRSGASVSNPGMLSSDDFDGVDRTHLGTSGWALGSFDGGPSFLALNGRDVFADLTAKDAALTAQLVSINALIDSELTYGSIKGYIVGSATTTTRTNMAVAAITIPAGFTRALVWAFSDAVALNSTASPDYLYVATAINSYDGGENSEPCQSGFVITASHSAATQLTGLVGGGVVNCRVSTRTNTAPWAASGANLWRVQGVAIFAR